MINFEIKQLKQLKNMIPKFQYPEILKFKKEKIKKKDFTKFFF